MKHNSRTHRIKWAALLAAGAAGVAVARALARPSIGNPRVPEPAKPVDLERYAGHWYELGRYDNRFERGCEAVTATYTRRPDGLIQVVNACSDGARGGRPRRATGRAKVVSDSLGAKLKVSFFGPLFRGNYWVLDHAEDYAWSIVGEPSGRYLWILTREPSPAENVKDTLVGRARALGYDMTRFRHTRQTPAAVADRATVAQ